MSAVGRRSAVLAALALASTALAPGASAGAHSTHDTHSAHSSHGSHRAHVQAAAKRGAHAQVVDAAHLLPTAGAGKVSGLTSGRQAVFVRLRGPGAVSAARTEMARSGGPVRVRTDAAQQAALARRAQVRRTASAALATAVAIDPSARRLFEVGNALPGLGLVADGPALRAVARRADVVSVAPLVPKQPANANAAALTRVLDTWQNTGLTGTGVTVGVIDTGLDFTHADFGGAGTSDAYSSALADDTDPDWQSTLPSLAAAKVAGGYDFAGDAYDAGTASTDVPQPDADPLDCNGHGTHVAGTVAGYGVTSDGATFTGSYAGLDRNALLAMGIGPGMAPTARLYPLKIFGCSGSSDLLIPALDRALDPNDDGDFSDHLGIVDISLTSNYSTPDDPDNAEIDAVAADGVLPVVAIGNGGDRTDVGGSPANATRALAVASSVDSYQLQDGLRVTAPADAVPNGIAGGQDARTYTYPSGPVSGTVVTMPGDDGTPAHNNADGCNTFGSSQRAAVSGRIVWLEWDDDPATRRCNAITRAAHAAAAGAVGVLLTEQQPVFAGPISGSTLIPVFQLDDDATTALRSAIGAPLQVTFDPALRNAVPTLDDSISDTMSTFSSRGTHGSLGVVKPDVTAPGDTIASAGIGSGSGVAVESGTSMAAAHVAGIAALVEQTHPGWSAEQVKAAVMNTADHDIHVSADPDSAVYGPARDGAGRVDALDAVTTPLLAFNADAGGAVSASFGVVTDPVDVATLTRTQQITVQNTGDTDEPVTVGYAPAVSEPGVSYSTDTDSLTVLAHDAATVTVTMTVVARNLRHTIDPTMSASTELGDGLPAQNRQYLSDASGRLVITPTDTSLPALRVPVYGAARPASTLTATGGTDEVRRSGSSFDQGPSSPDSTTWTSYAVPMSLDATSPALPACSSSVTTKCTENQTARGGDIRYVGSGSFPGAVRGKPSFSTGYFYIGISTYGDSATLGTAVQPYALIDVNHDGTPDFRSYVADLPGTDVLLNNVVKISTGAIVDQEFVNWEDGSVDTNVFDTNTVIMPIWLPALGVKDDTTTRPVTFSVGESSRYAVNANGDIDDVGPITVDAVQPNVAVGVTPGLVPLFAGHGSIPALVTRPDTKALVFFLHNLDDVAGDTPNADRDQVVTLQPIATKFSSRAPSSIRAGSAARITGRLRMAGAAALAKATVTLSAEPSGSSSYHVVATRHTDSTGAVALHVRPTRTTTYRWHYVGTAGHGSATSTPRTVHVHNVVSIGARPHRVTGRQSFVLYGTTRPLVSGAVVHVQQQATHGWRTVHTITTRQQQLPNGVFEAGYRFRTHASSKGAHRYRARWPATSGRDSGTSAPVIVTVH